MKTVAGTFLAIAIAYVIWLGVQFATVLVSGAFR